MTNPINLLNTTRVRTAIRVAIATAVGSVVAYASTKWGNFHTGQFAFLDAGITAAYYGAVSWAETKFPKLGWLLGVLPQPKPQPKALPVVKKSAVK